MSTADAGRETRDATPADDSPDSAQRECSLPVDPDTSQKTVSWSLPENVPERTTATVKKKPTQRNRRLVRSRDRRVPRFAAMSTPVAIPEFDPADDLRLRDYSSDLSRVILPGLDSVGRMKSFGAAELCTLTSASGLGDLGTVSARMMLQGFAGFERRHREQIFESLRDNLDADDVGSFPSQFRWIDDDQVSGNFVPFYVFEITPEIAGQVYKVFNIWRAAFKDKSFMGSSVQIVKESINGIDDRRMRFLVGTLAKHFPFFRHEVRVSIVECLQNPGRVVHPGDIDIDSTTTEASGDLASVDGQGGNAEALGVPHSGSGVSSLRSVTTSFMMEACNYSLLAKELMQTIFDEFENSGTPGDAESDGE